MTFVILLFVVLSFYRTSIAHLLVVCNYTNVVCIVVNGDVVVKCIE